MEGARGESRRNVDHEPPCIEAGLQVLEGLIYLLERICSGQQFVELQLPLAIEREQSQRVAMDVGAAVPAADQTLLHDRNEEDVQAHRLLARADANHHAGAPFSHGGVSLLDG